MKQINYFVNLLNYLRWYIKIMKVNQKIEKGSVRKNQTYRMSGLVNMVFIYEGICEENPNRVRITELINKRAVETKTIPAGWIKKDCITKL